MHVLDSTLACILALEKPHRKYLSKTGHGHEVNFLLVFELEGIVLVVMSQQGVLNTRTAVSLGWLFSLQGFNPLAAHFVVLGTCSDVSRCLRAGPQIRILCKYSALTSSLGSIIVLS